MSAKVTSWISLVAMLVLAGVLTFQLLERMHYEDNVAPNVSVWGGQ